MEQRSAPARGDFVSGEAIGYDATHIQVLQEWEAIRKRPGTYVGSTGERGLHALVFEVVDREADAGRHKELPRFESGSAARFFARHLVRAVSSPA